MTDITGWYLPHPVYFRAPWRIWPDRLFNGKPHLVITVNLFHVFVQCKGNYTSHMVAVDCFFVTHIFIKIMISCYKGRFECFFGGFVSFLVASDCKALITLKRVCLGSITSSR